MIVHGCLTCEGSEHPQVTFTALYRDGQGEIQFSWVCQECVGAQGVERLRDLAEADIFCLNEQMREAYEGARPSGRMTARPGWCWSPLARKPSLLSNMADAQPIDYNHHTEKQT